MNIIKSLILAAFVALLGNCGPPKSPSAASPEAQPEPGPGQILIQGTVLEVDMDLLNNSMASGNFLHMEWGPAEYPSYQKFETGTFSDRLSTEDSRDYKKLIQNHPEIVRSFPAMIFANGQAGKLFLGKSLPAIKGYHEDPVKGRVPEIGNADIGVQLTLSAATRATPDKARRVLFNMQFTITELKDTPLTNSRDSIGTPREVVSGTRTLSGEIGYGETYFVNLHAHQY